MSSFNYIGSRWAGGCKELLQNVCLLYTSAAGTLKAFEEKLAERPFARCNSGYLVNLAQVKSVQQGDVYKRQVPALLTEPNIKGSEIFSKN